jgi:hypothetical protein
MLNVVNQVCLRNSVCKVFASGSRPLVLESSMGFGQTLYFRKTQSLLLGLRVQVLAQDEKELLETLLSKKLRFLAQDP